MNCNNTHKYTVSQYSITKMTKYKFKYNETIQGNIKSFVRRQPLLVLTSLMMPHRISKNVHVIQTYLRVV